MFCWETLGGGNYVDVSWDGPAPWQQHNAFSAQRCKKAEEREEFKMWTRLGNSVVANQKRSFPTSQCKHHSIPTEEPAEYILMF